MSDGTGMVQLCSLAATASDDATATLVAIQQLSKVLPTSIRSLSLPSIIRIRRRQVFRRALLMSRADRRNTTAFGIVRRRLILTRSVI